MAKMQLQQIKTFPIYGDQNQIGASTRLDEDVNKYVIQRYNETGNIPKIKTTSKYISVISNVLVDVTRDK